MPAPGQKPQSRHDRKDLAKKTRTNSSDLILCVLCVFAVQLDFDWLADRPGPAWYDLPMRLGSPLAALLALTAAAVAPACRSAPPATATAPAAVAAPPAAPPVSDADDDAVGRPFLWEVRGKAGTSYLFGTIHAGFQADRELPQVVWDKLAAADTFVMEADITEVRPMELMKLAALPEGQRLDDLLGAEDWKRLQAMVGGGVPASSLKVLAPWFVYSLVLQTLYPTPTPLDLALQTRARSLGKRMTYLEDWRFQIDILSSVMGLDDLRQLVTDGGKAREQLDAMIAAYRAGDFARISAIALDPEEAKAHPERMKRMFDDRNRAWIETLGPELDRGSMFIAVGVGHFAGEVGLLRLLRERGYIVKRIAP
jgi:uncharacterized protein